MFRDAVGRRIWVGDVVLLKDEKAEVVGVPLSADSLRMACLAKCMSVLAVAVPAAPLPSVSVVGERVVAAVSEELELELDWDDDVSELSELDELDELLRWRRCCDTDATWSELAAVAAVEVTAFPALLPASPTVLLVVKVAAAAVAVVSGALAPVSVFVAMSMLLVDVCVCGVGVVCVACVACVAVCVCVCVCVAVWVASFRVCVCVVVASFRVSDCVSVCVAVCVGST